MLSVKSNSNTIAFFFFFFSFILMSQFANCQQLQVDGTPLQHSVEINNSGLNGILIDSTLRHGLEVKNTGLNGIYLRQIGLDGIAIESPQANGINISGAQENGISISSVLGDGVEVTGGDIGVDLANQQLFGMRISDPVNFGMSVINSGQSGITVAASGADGVFISDAQDDGIQIINSGDNGIEISNATDDGINIKNVLGDGVEISGGDLGLNLRNQSIHAIDISKSSDASIRIDSSGGGAAIEINDPENYGIITHNPTAGLQVISPGNYGVELIGAPIGILSWNASLDHFLAVGGATGFRTAGCDRAAYYTTSESSPIPAVYIASGTDSVAEISFGGHAQITSNGSYHLQLDDNGNSGSDKFDVLNTGGTSVFNVNESGNGGVTGNFSKGGGSFKIDHPLDPENKYLYHSFVESPDMMNVYNGNVVLDEKGAAAVELPEYFEALNRDFRYQLTCVGGFAPIYIGEKLKNNQFTISGGFEGLEVSWQITGIRQDVFANENRIPNVVDKEVHNKGRYLHANAWAKSKNVKHLPGHISISIPDEDYLNDAKQENEGKLKEAGKFPESQFASGPKS